MEIYDIYVFVEDASKKTIENFISKYLKNAISEDSYFEYPKYQKTILYETSLFENMFDFITDKSFKKYTFYFKCLGWNEGKGGIIQTYDDNSVCLGLSVFPDYVDKYYRILEKNYPPENIFISYYDPPPQNSNQVREILKRKA